MRALYLQLVVLKHISTLGKKTLPQPSIAGDKNTIITGVIQADVNKYVSQYVFANDAV